MMVKFFLQITNRNRFCVFASSVNPTTMKRQVNIFMMQGVLCSVEILEENAVITIQNSEISDCKWNGQICALLDSGLRTTFNIDAPEFSIFPIKDFLYQNSGGKIFYENEAKQFYTIIESPLADLYVNLSTSDEKSWCIVSSECTPKNFKPVSLLYASHNAICSTREISYHQFRITAKRLE